MRHTTNIVAALAMTTLVSISYGSGLPRNSYIVKPVKNVNDLVGQIKNNDVVADRYMRHFSMDKSEVLNYVGGLHVSQLVDKQAMLVYGVPQDGKIHATRQTLPKGDKLFVDRFGNPVMRVVCGNPVTLGPKRPYAMNDVHGTPVNRSAETIPTILPEGSDLVNGSSLVAMQPSIEPEAPIASVSTPAEATQVILPTSGGGNAFPLLIPLLAAGTSRGGGGSTAVPEPMSMMALGAGVAAVLAKKRKK